MAQPSQPWESKLILLLILPASAVSVLLQAHACMARAPGAVLTVLGLSALLTLAAWKTRAAQPAAALTGGLLTAAMMFSTTVFPYRAWQTALVPVVTLLLLTSFGTRFRRERKEALGIAELRGGRGAAQVAANLGAAALAFTPTVTAWMSARAGLGAQWVGVHNAALTGTGANGGDSGPVLLFCVGLAALAEAAADTISSEVGQGLGGKPRMLTTLRIVPHGTDGAITAAGTAAGIVAAGVVSLSGTLAWHGGARMMAISWAGGMFGLFFDSLLGATVEGPRGLNNDAVNFLSTASAAAAAAGLLAWLH